MPARPRICLVPQSALQQAALPYRTRLSHRRATGGDGASARRHRFPAVDPPRRAWLILRDQGHSSMSPIRRFRNITIELIQLNSARETVIVEAFTALEEQIPALASLAVQNIGERIRAAH